jgi:hypothetical protein
MRRGVGVVALVVAVTAAACAADRPDGPTTRSAADAPTRSTTTTAPGLPTLERTPAEPGVLAAQGDQRMAAIAVDPAGPVAVAVGSDQGGPALWRAVAADVWVRLPRPDEMPPDARLADVAVSDTGGFMVVGAVGGGAAAWSSADGSVWSRADVDDGPPIEFVSDTSVGPVAFSAGADPVAWKSWDGQVWLRAGRMAPAAPAMRTRVVGAVAADAGVLVVADAADGPRLWSSPDGFSWSIAGGRDEEVLAGAGKVSVGAVLAGRGRSIEIGGSVQDGFGLDAAVWRSEGGRSWEPVPPDLNVFGGDGGQVVTAMVTDPEGRSVAVGTDTPDGGEEADVAVWSSSGESWRRADPDALRRPGHQEVRDVAVLGDAVVAVGYERVDGEDDAAVWQVGSADVEAPVVAEGPGLNWTRIDAEALAAPGEQRLTGVTTTPGGYIAVGVARAPLTPVEEPGPSREIGPVPVGASDGAVWVSPDAREWARVEADALGGDGDQELLAVAQGPEVLLAVGRDGDDAAVWWSPDGTAWRRAPDPEGQLGGAGRQAIRDVVAVGEGFLAVGADGGGPDGDGAVWASEDGRSWRRLAVGSFGGPGRQTMDGIALGGEAAVVVGSHGDQAAVWSSSDLVEWRRELLGPGRAEAVAGLDGSVVAVGAAPADDGAQDAVTWRLVGQLWERHGGGDLERPANQRQLGVVLGEELAIAVGVTDAGGGEDAASWVSTDAVTWSATPHDENVLGGSGAQRMTDVASDGTTAVAVGWSGSTPEARDAVVWVADQVDVTGPEGRL